MGAVRYRVLGPVEVLDGSDAPRTPRGALQRRLLALLLLRSGQMVTVDRIADVLWPEGGPADLAAAVQTHVFRLRRSLPDGVLETTASGYRIVADPGHVDAGSFESAVANAAALRADSPADALALLDEALSWWRGRPYEDLIDHDDGRVEAARLDELRLLAVEERFATLIDLGHSHEVIADLYAHAAKSPMRERPAALLMTALQLTGRARDALRVFTEHRTTLATELGIDPSPGLRELHDEIVRADAEGPSWASSTHRPVRTHVPEAPNDLLGREQVLVRIGDDLERGRLLTLIGTGGVGKTRLAIEAAHRFGDRFTDGVYWCDLMVATDHDSVFDVAASALEVRLQEGASAIERICDVLRSRATLVILDNCEHVIDAAAQLATAILAGTRGGTILATSRERLAVPGELLCPVSPLPVPTGDLDSAAVGLFVERARAVGADIAPTAEVAELCRQLDGLPLAIELAAARLHSMDVEEVRAGLRRRFQLLTTGPRTSTRHRSLAAAVAWSYDLLSEQERSVFEKLSVFAAPFDADAAAAVTETPIDEITLLLAGLVERSLVQRVGRRHALLETLRQFGAERLAEKDGTDEVLRRHALHFVGVAEAARLALGGDRAAGVLDELEAVLPDLNAAHRWLLANGEIDAALRNVVALYEFGIYRMHPEVHDAAGQAAAAARGSGHPLLPSALAISEFSIWARGFHGRSSSTLQDSLDLAGPDLSDSYLPLISWADYALVGGRLDEALEWYPRAMATRTARTDVVHGTWGRAMALLAHGYRGDDDAAQLAATFAAELEQRAPSPHVAFGWYSTGEALLETDVELARERLRRAVDIAERCGATFVLGVAGTSLASIETRYGDAEVAAREYRWLLDHWQRSGVVVTLWTMLRAVAVLLARRGQEHEAAVLLGAVMSSPHGNAMFGADVEHLTALERDLRERLGDERFAEALAAGQALDTDDVVAFTIAAVRR